MRLTVRKLVHINQVVGDLDKAIGFYTDVFGAQEYWRGYDAEQRRDAGLFVIGDVCIELFAPRDAESLLGASLTRYGPSWHSFEWQVPDLDAARQAFQERGVRLPTDRPDAFFMTHPADCHGMLLELTPLEMAGDPRIREGWSAAPWREHPLGITGLHNLSVAVRDVAAASDWLTDLVDGATVRYRSRITGADAVGVGVADHVVELVQPTGDSGPVADYLSRFGQRLRSIEFGVEDLPRAVAHLRSAGLTVIEGSRDGAQAIRESDNWGVRWEFAERPVG
ncbi:MAG TPA: VOC family protein [Amycolatopsis sp.]|nr:VOC family protein [Amycolatopsis sp.]